MAEKKTTPPATGTVKRTKAGDETMRAVAARNQGWKEVAEQNRFKVISGAGVAIMGGVALLVSFFMPVKDNFFSVDEAGRITKMVPLDKPSMSDAAVINFADRCLVKSNFWNFQDVNYRLNEALAECFTDAGAKEYFEAQQDNIKTVKEKEMFVQLTLDNPPVIVKKGVMNGVLLYKLQASGILKFYTATDFSNVKTTFTVVVARRSISESPQGMGIVRVSSRSGGAQ